MRRNTSNHTQAADAAATKALLEKVDAGRYRSPQARRASKKLRTADEEEARRIEPGYDPTRFPKPSVSADVLILSPDSETKRLGVLLIERKRKPYQGYWAFPGGFVDLDEEVSQSARRELEEETNLGERALKRIPLHCLGLADAPGRDPRDRVITVVHVALLPGSALKRAPFAAGDDAADVRLFPVEGPETPSLAFDHAAILAEALDWLRWHCLHTPVLRPLLPARFPFTTLKETVELVLGTALNGPTLRRLLLARRVIESLGKPEDSRHTEYRFTAMRVI